MAPDDRRAAILDAAARLLKSRGWEDVTINEILNAATISRGGFYHHFASKDEILRALVLRFADAATVAAAAGQKTAGSGSIERLSAFLRSALKWELDHADEVMSIVRLARQPGNELLFLGFGRETERRTLPVLEDLLRDGVDRGAFDLPDIAMTADLLIRVSRTRWLDFIDLHDTARAGSIDRARLRLDRRIRAEQQTYERLLGLPAGSMELLPKQSYERLLQ